MKKTTGIFKILQREYLNCSINGNPKQLLILEDDNGGVMIARTATDSLCGYYEYTPGKKFLFTYHFTRKNANMIIDYCEEV